MKQNNKVLSVSLGAGWGYKPFSIEEFTANWKIIGTLTKKLLKDIYIRKTNFWNPVLGAATYRVESAP